MGKIVATMLLHVYHCQYLWARYQNNKCTTVNIYGHGTKITYVIPQSLIQFYPESGIQNNKCSTTVFTDQVLYCSSALCIFKSMINNPEFRQFILQVQSGVI